MKKMNNKGFSLIELIIVIAIMAVLVAIIAPNLTKYLGKSKTQADKTNLEEVRKQAQNCIAEAGTEDISVISGTATSATYVVKGTGSAVTVTTGAGGDSNFATLLKGVFEADLNTKSKANPSNNAIQVVITGDVSNGFTVTCSFVAS